MRAGEILKGVDRERYGVLLEALPGLPAWLLAGVSLGVVASLVVAGIFVAGESFFPTARRSEGRRIDGTLRRREEIRSYLRTIGEPFVEDHDLSGVTVAFYLTDRDVAITFDPKAFFTLGGDDTRVVFCEHEMPGSHLGRRLPFDVDDRFTAATVSDPVRAAFAVLDVDPDADVAAVKAAYRAKVKEVHPDAGGDQAAFRRVREAYATAKSHAES